MAGSNKRANRRAKDAATAAMLKAMGVKREVLRCPVCYKIVTLQHFPQHLQTQCKGDR